MGFILPRMEWTLNLTGLSRKIRLAYGRLIRPEEKFRIINTAQDPDGLYYWKWVNDGTGPKEASSAPYLVFMIDGEIIRKYAVKGNPPVNMLDRALVELHPFFKEALRERKLLGPSANPADVSFEWMNNVFERTAEKLKELLEELTPEIQDKYINDDPIYGTPQPGLLRDSYEVISLNEVEGGAE